MSCSLFLFAGRAHRFVVDAGEALGRLDAEGARERGDVDRASMGQEVCGRDGGAVSDVPHGSPPCVRVETTVIRCAPRYR